MIIILKTLLIEMISSVFFVDLTIKRLLINTIGSIIKVERGKL